MARLIRPEGSRMERLLVPNNWLDRLQRSSDRTRIYLRRAHVSRAARRLGYHGRVEQEPMVSGEIDFSDDEGESFGQLSEPEGNRIIQMRCQITQHVVTPMIMGLKLIWILPAGWVFTDNLPDTTYERVCSNPLTVTRTIRAPIDPIKVGFKVRIGRRKYRH